jgi:hypothetical protein
MPVIYDAERNTVLVDYSNMKPMELIAEAERVHNEARLHLSEMKVKVLVDVTGASMSSEAVRALKDATKRDSAMVERTAIVGVTGLKRILADAIATFSGTQTRCFDTKHEALEWLAKPE